MKHNNILYILLLIVLVFLIIYKSNILEGFTYTYFPNMNKTFDGTFIGNNVKYKDCENACSNNGLCKGFTSDLPLNSNVARTGECRVFLNDNDLNKSNLKNLKYQYDSYLYIKN
jgi:hypothetical protein